MSLTRSALQISLATLGLLAVAATVPAGERPNIVLIMADDLGYSDLGCYGGEIETPNLDRLAADGLRFTQFYNCAKCTTTRASLLTGLDPRRDTKLLLRPDMVTIGEVLQAAGYRTSLSGKWHLGSTPLRRPIDRGFEEYYGLMDGCCNYFDPARRDPPYEGGRVRVFGHNDRLITDPEIGTSLIFATCPRIASEGGGNQYHESHESHEFHTSHA